ncbi:unnamed protein product [Effrenium voratum]|uniref:Uncharacterized protein n=1 Tax=Effrenium voratum TaxID=2562239 RepID=A0AA36N7P6_9DINO|nr:unnamed protein product [Effrenium voratum]|mmetsp:Transcript_59959/g.143177  ORF Transcript_59959/g.143177 Transcript_59959/m.143177 type:complete len:224 (-) Transcript_59959:58-729(-)
MAAVAEPAEPESEVKDWHDLECALRELRGSVARLEMPAEGPAPEPTQERAPEAKTQERRRLPSIFAASCESDIKLLNRCYTPNIFAWDALCPVGVQDDVNDLQLRVAYRLRCRAEALQKQDLEEIRALQRQEMKEADEFMHGFDAHQWLQQGPLPLAAKRPHSGAPPKSAPKSQAGPLPRDISKLRPAPPPEVPAPMASWPRRQPLSPLADVTWGAPSMWPRI